MDKIHQEMDEDTDGIFRTILGTIPERKDQLIEMYEKYKPLMRQAPDKIGFSLEGGPFGSISFTYRTLQHIWLSGFISWKAMYSYAGLLFLFRFFPDDEFDMDKVGVLPDQRLHEEAFDKALVKLKELSRSEVIEDYQWPTFVPQPTGRPKDDEGALVFDLIIMATAYIFLHEIKHIHFSQDGDAPPDPVIEELECDKYARSMLLDELPSYSETSGYDLEALNAKRGMSIALASFIILVVTPTSLWNTSRTHPPIGRRIQTLIEHVKVSENNYLWDYIGSMLLSIMKHNNIKFKPIVFQSPKQFCIKLLNILIEQEGPSASS